MIDLNEKEVFTLMVLVSTDRREKSDESVEGEMLELKLVKALLTETGHWPPTVTDRQQLEALRMLEEHRLLEEQK